MFGFDEDIFVMQMINADYLTEILKIWTCLFNQDTTKLHLNKLKEQTRVFYRAILQESKEQKEKVRKTIEDNEQELLSLASELKIEVQLPTHDNCQLSMVELQVLTEEMLGKLHELLKEQQNKIEELLIEQCKLCEELGESPLEIRLQPLPDSEELDKLNQNIERLKREREMRLEKLTELRMEIKGYLNQLGVKCCNSIEERMLNDADTPLNEHTFATLEYAKNRYKNEVKDIREQIDNIKGKLELLWDRLGTSNEAIEQFKRLSDYSRASYELLYNELQRRETEKRENIKHYVLQLRAEINIWAKKIYQSEAQLKTLHSNCYTDDLAELHERELDDLRNFYYENERIFQLYAKRNELRERLNVFNDPKRYNNRGGTLLKEEKDRKLIATKLPEIEQEIKTLVRAYEERVHRSFLINGRDILQIMATDNLRPGVGCSKHLVTQSARTVKKTLQTPTMTNQQSTSSANRLQGCRTDLCKKSASYSCKAVNKTRLNISISSKSQRAIATSRRLLTPISARSSSSSRTPDKNEFTISLTTTHEIKEEAKAKTMAPPANSRVLRTPLSRWNVSSKVSTTQKSTSKITFASSNSLKKRVLIPANTEQSPVYAKKSSNIPKPSVIPERRTFKLSMSETEIKLFNLKESNQENITPRGFNSKPKTNEQSLNNARLKRP